MSARTPQTDSRAGRESGGSRDERQGDRRRSGRAGRAARSGRRDTADALRSAADELRSAIAEGSDYLPTGQVREAEAVLGRATERLVLSGSHTVVALAGATGSGKSSLFNALVGQEVARSGHLRPTTSRTSAAVWGEEPATELLDWLRVRDRHQVEPGGGPGVSGASGASGAADQETGDGSREGRRWFGRREREQRAVGNPDGLVLLDLPDIDSTRAAHRAEADRVLAMTDVFVWVTDPQKYADARLHDEYLGKARHHEAVTLVVLNQIDRLGDVEATECLEDLRRLLAADGMSDVEVLGVSAATGAGLTELFAALTEAVAAAEATRLRLLGDVREAAAGLRRHVADSESSVGERPSADLIDALADSAGVPVVLASVAADHRRRALASTGWPFTRWARRLRPDPLKRLRLEAARDRKDGDEASAELERLVQRSSLPQPTPAARAAVDVVTRRLGSAAAQGLPRPWADAVEQAAEPESTRLADSLDQAILGASLHLRRPLWWSVVGALQWVLAIAAVAGVLWLTALAAMGWLQLPVPETPTLWYLPVPTLLAVGGLLGGVLLALLSRVMAAAEARRRMRVISLRLRDRIGEVADRQLLAPVDAVLTRHRATREHLDAAIAA